MLSERDILFFKTFGYLHIRGYFAQEISWITEEFETVWKARRDVVHDGSQRTIFPETFVGASPRLATLIEHPKVVAVCSALLDPGYAFQGGDGNFYSGDTDWHSDAFGVWPEKTTARHLKIAWYLDALTRDTGSLRVIPGSHLEGDRYCAALEHEIPPWMPGTMKLPGREVPCVAIENLPGDLVCFDHRTKHAAFGGSSHRRMFTTNWIQGAHTPAMRESILNIYRFYRDHEKVDWSRPQGPWFTHPPAARAPLLQQLKEFSQIMVQEAASRDALARSSATASAAV
jgi:hypothetical protein